MNRLFCNLLLSLMAAAVLYGCASTAVQPLTSSDKAAAYGNITLPDGNITNVMLFKVGEVYAPPIKSPPKGHIYTNGNFLFENLEPGKYFLVGFMSGQNAFYFNYRGLEKEEFIKKVAIDVEPGSVTYMGSFKVTGIDRHLLKTDTFDIKRSSSPSRNVILEDLKIAAAGTGWDKRIEEAIK